MHSFTFKTHSSEIQLRQVQVGDIPRLIELNKQAFPLMAEENVVWSERQLSNHLKLFPDGPELKLPK